MSPHVQGPPVLFLVAGGRIRKAKNIADLGQTHEATMASCGCFRKSLAFACSGQRGIVGVVQM